MSKQEETKLTTIDAPDGMCYGCKFMDDRTGCNSHPCTPEHRDDDRMVIWVDVVDDIKETP